MRRKYGDCKRKDGNCTLCSLVSNGLDCRNRPISKLMPATLPPGTSWPWPTCRARIRGI